MYPQYWVGYISRWNVSIYLCIFSNLLIYSLNQKSQQVGRTVCLRREGVRETPISDIL